MIQYAISSTGNENCNIDEINALGQRSPTEARDIVQVKNLDFFYGSQQALFDISVNIQNHKVTALIGPSGCGKSTFLRMLNRMNDLIDVTHFRGEVIIDDENIYAEHVDVVALRKKVGMVFQKSNPFPKSIFENVAYGPRIHRLCNKSELNYIVEKALHQANLWDEVKDRLHKNALFLSGGQQQRLCIARALAVEPEILLMDEPASALDPRSTAKVEELIQKLSSKVTIIIVTHNLQQAARVSQQTIFFYEGRLIEQGLTKIMFSTPQEKHTQNYIFGHFG